MHEEHPFIPEQASALPPGPWLVFAPDLNDGLRGMGGTLLLGARQATAITLLMLKADAATAAARDTAARLGISLHDGSGTSNSTSSEQITRLLTELRPQSVFFPTPLEPQARCRAVTTAAWASLGHSTFAGTAYAYEISLQGPANRWIDISAVAADKADLIQADSSRTAALTMTLNRARGLLTSTATQAEAFYAFDSTAGTLATHLAHSLTPCWRDRAVVSQPLVSVLIRTRNRPALLQEALRSVVTQTYAPIEVIVVNDGGDDVEAEVQSCAGPALAQVRYCNVQPGRGRSAAANIALEAATGDYLIFLDDDDWFLPEHIAALVETLQHHQAAVAYAGVECVQDNGQGDWQRVHVFGRPFDPVQLLIDNYIPMHAALFRRELIAAGCRFDEAMDTFEDWDFWVQLAQKSPFVYVDRISAVYRIGQQGGFGVGGEQRRIRQATEYFLNKWRSRWTLEQVLEIVTYAKHKSLYSELVTYLDAKDRQLIEAQQAHKDLLERIEARNAAVYELGQVREQLAAAEQHLHDQQTRYQEQLAVAHTQLTHAQGYIQALNEQIARFERSSSWKVTRPLRAITEVLRKVRRGLLKQGAGVENG